MYIWTASANERVYKNTRITRNSMNFLILESAKNAYVSGQILLRSIEGFEVLDVKAHTDLPCDIYYQRYNVFNDGLPYPDELVDIKHEGKLLVHAHSTQGIWLNLFIPKEAKEGRLNFHVEISTSQGIFTVPVYLNIYNVTIPDTKNSEFNLEYFFLPFDFFPYKDKKEVKSFANYGYKRYSDKWWELMGEYAKSFLQIRNNSLDIRIMPLLADAGSREVENNKWEFNWELFDRFVKFFIDKKAVKSLSCCSIINPVLNDTVLCLDEHSNIVSVKIESEKGEAFTDAFYSALYEHIRELGLLDIFRMRLQDEPHQDKYWIWARKKVERLMPGVVCGEPLDMLSVSKQLKDYCDQFIPRIEVYEEGVDFFRDMQNAGKEVWVYSCCFPEEHWFLNKFIDHPHVHSRLMTWACYSQNITGFLHWGYNYFAENDLYSCLPNARFKGDGHIVYPNTEHNTINISTRFIATRDGIQDYELLKIAERKFKDDAFALSRRIARSFLEFDNDPESVDNTVSKLLKLAEVSQNMV